MLVDVTDRFEIPEKAKAVVTSKSAVVGDYLVNKSPKKITILTLEDELSLQESFLGIRVKVIKRQNLDLESFDDPSKQIGLFVTEERVRLLATQNFLDYLKWNSCRTWNFENTTLDRFLCAYWKGKMQRTYLKQLQWVAWRCSFSEDLGVFPVELESYKIRSERKVVGYFDDDTIIVEQERGKPPFVQTWLDYLQYDELQDFYKRVKQVRLFGRGKKIRCLVVLQPEHAEIVD